MRNLVIDIGNTRVKYGIFHQDELVEEQVQMLLRAGPHALAQAKRLVQDVADADPQRRDELRRTTAALIARLRGSAEGQEGLAAFLEKRPAAWTTPDKTD